MNKRELLNKLLFVPTGSRGGFYKKEYALLNQLLKKYPDLNFWKIVDVEKVSSLTLYLGEDIFQISHKYKNYDFQPKFKNTEFELGEKYGEDYNTAKQPKTIKNFLK